MHQLLVSEAEVQPVRIDLDRSDLLQTIREIEVAIGRVGPPPAAAGITTSVALDPHECEHVLVKPRRVRPARCFIGRAVLSFSVFRNIARSAGILVFRPPPSPAITSTPAATAKSALCEHRHRDQQQCERDERDLLHGFITLISVSSSPEVAAFFFRYPTAAFAPRDSAAHP